MDFREAELQKEFRLQKAFREQYGQPQNTPSSWDAPIANSPITKGIGKGVGAVKDFLDQHKAQAMGTGAAVAATGLALAPVPTALALGIGALPFHGPKLSDRFPETAKSLNLDPDAKDAAMLLAPELAARYAPEGNVVSGLRNMVKAGEPKPPQFPLNAPLEAAPKPMPPYAPEDVQNLADLSRQGKDMDLQNQANQAIEAGAKPLKQSGLQSSEVAKKIVSNSNVPIEQSDAAQLLKLFPDDANVQKIASLAQKNPLVPVQTKGNRMLPEFDTIIDKGEYSPLGPPDSRFKTHFQDAAETQTPVEINPAYEARDYTPGSEQLPAPDNQQNFDFYQQQNLGPQQRPMRTGEENIRMQSEPVGAPSQIFHAPETVPALSADQYNLPFEDNPDVYGAFQKASQEARYTPNKIETDSMKAKRQDASAVANNLRSTIQNSTKMLPPNLTQDDLNVLAQHYPEGQMLDPDATGVALKSLMGNTRNAIGLQGKIAPSVGKGSSLSLMNRIGNGGDARAAAQRAAEEFGVTEPLDFADKLKAANDHVKNQATYMDELSRASNQNKAAQARYSQATGKALSNHATELLNYYHPENTITPTNFAMDTLNDSMWGVPPEQALLKNGAKAFGASVRGPFRRFMVNTPEQELGNGGGPWGALSGSMNVVNGRNSNEQK